MTPVIADAAAAEAYWDAEYAFFHKIITDEVMRERFNRGLESIELVLYQVRKDGRKHYIDYVGETQIGRQLYAAVAKKHVRSDRQEVIKIRITPKP